MAIRSVPCPLKLKPINFTSIWVAISLDFALVWMQVSTPKTLLTICIELMPCIVASSMINDEPVWHDGRIISVNQKALHRVYYNRWICRSEFFITYSAYSRRLCFADKNSMNIFRQYAALQTKSSAKNTHYKSCVCAWMTLIHSAYHLMLRIQLQWTSALRRWNPKNGLLNASISFIIDVLNNNTCWSDSAFEITAVTA